MEKGIEFRYDIDIVREYRIMIRLKRERNGGQFRMVISDNVGLK